MDTVPSHDYWPPPGQRDVGLRGAGVGGRGQAGLWKPPGSLGSILRPGVSKAPWAARGHPRVWGLLFLCTLPQPTSLPEPATEPAGAPGRVCQSVRPLVMTDSVFHRLQPTRLLCPWKSPGKNTGAGCHAFPRGVLPTQGLNPGLLHFRQILYHLSHQGPHTRQRPALNPQFSELERNKQGGQGAEGLPSSG